MSSLRDSSTTRHSGEIPGQHYFSPGRINLVGEHTDYNDGLVLPVAVHLGTHFDVRPNEELALRIHSVLMKDSVRVELDSGRALPRSGDWSDYFVGVVNEFLALPCEPRGLDIVVDSTLPVGCGLSSSASVATGLAAILNDEWHAGQSRSELAFIARRAENDFVGLACGILDQFAVALSEHGRALVLDCGTMEWRSLPFPEDRYAMIAVDSAIRRQLKDSGYNRRREECERALDLIRSETEAASLSALTMTALEGCNALKGDPVAMRRARHVVSENQRVRRAAEALESDDLEALGQAMFASHESLRADYEVSCRELDLLVELAQGQPGVAGAKMTGGGFGGSVVVLVTRDAADAVAESIVGSYRSKTGLDPVATLCRPSNGVHKTRSRKRPTSRTGHH